jgi:hypothetical protein
MSDCCQGDNKSSSFLDGGGRIDWLLDFQLFREGCAALKHFITRFGTMPVTRLVIHKHETRKRFVLSCCESSTLVANCDCCVPQQGGSICRCRTQSQRVHRKQTCEEKRQSGPGYLGQYSDSLRARWPGDRIPVEARFSAPVQTGPGAHPNCYTMCIGSLSRG